MKPRASGTVAGLLPLAVSGNAGPRDLGAQARLGGQAEPTAGWSPISLGVRAGYDNAQRDQVVGAQVRIPILPSGVVELMPNGDITFLRRSKEYQLNIELVYLTGGPAGGLYAGGGVGFRNSIFGADPVAARKTVQTYSLAGGVRFGNFGRVNPQIEVRWVFVDELPRNPQQVTVGVSFALWGRSRPGR